MRATVRCGAAVFAVGVVLGGCTIEKTEEGRAPEVEVKGGELPEIDIEPADVDVTMDTQQVIVPKIDVDPRGEPDRDP